MTYPCRCKRQGARVTDSISTKIQGQQFPILPWHIAKSVGEWRSIIIDDLTESKWEMYNATEMHGQCRATIDRWTMLLGFVSIDQEMRTGRNGRITIERQRSTARRRVKGMFPIPFLFTSSAWLNDTVLSIRESCPYSSRRSRSWKKQQARVANTGYSSSVLERVQLLLQWKNTLENVNQASIQLPSWGQSSEVRTAEMKMRTFHVETRDLFDRFTISGCRVH